MCAELRKEALKRAIGVNPVSRIFRFSSAGAIATISAYAQSMTLSRLVHLRLRLLLPVRHAHVAVHSRRGDEVLLRLLPFASASGELAEAEVAAGDEGPHAARFGERQSLAVVGLAALGIEPVGVGCDVAEQMLRMGGEPGVTLRGFDGAVA